MDTTKIPKYVGLMREHVQVRRINHDASHGVAQLCCHHCCDSVVIEPQVGQVLLKHGVADSRWQERNSHLGLDAAIELHSGVSEALIKAAAAAAAALPAFFLSFSLPL